VFADFRFRRQGGFNFNATSLPLFTFTVERRVIHDGGDNDDNLVFFSLQHLVCSHLELDSKIEFLSSFNILQHYVESASAQGVMIFTYTYIGILLKLTRISH
jgi:hypothetical protein